MTLASSARNGSRVDASIAAGLIEQMLEMLGGCRPARLYRLIADEVGLHPVTLMRYHQGKLATASADTLCGLEQVLARVMAGTLSPPPRPGAPGTEPTTRKRVPAATLRPLFDRLMKALELTEREVLYRHLAERTGLNQTTLLRYHRGELSSAPASLERVMRGLLARCADGRYPELTRADGGRRVVPRALFKNKLDAVVRAGEYQHKTELFEALGRTLDVQPERLRKAYYDPKLQLVPAAYSAGLDRLLDRLEYDPSRTYRTGDRLRHPHFGVGVVRERRPHNRILVAFTTGKEILLREAYQHDRYWERAPVAEPWPEPLRAAP